MYLLQQYAVDTASRADCAHFAFLVRTFVSVNYPGTEPTYGLNLFNEFQFQSSARPTRKVWKLTVGGESRGYAVSTTKPDGSVKIGPVVMDPGFKSQGGMSQLLQYLSEHFSNAGKSALYGTYPASNTTIGAVCAKSGWEQVCAVDGLYRDDTEILTSIRLGAPLNHRFKETVEFLSAKPKRGGSERIYVPESTNTDELETFVGFTLGRIVNRQRIAYTVVSSSFANKFENRFELGENRHLLVWRHE